MTQDLLRDAREPRGGREKQPASSASSGGPTDRHPTDPSWRADALAGSRHSRLSDELRPPAEDHDPERAEQVCGEVTRRALRDLAPALMLLPVHERRRAQALAAFTLTLFDFAAQTGLEGERLSQINRLEFDLEQALDGEPRGQPAFVLLAAAESSRPWMREAIDEIVAAARRRATVPRPATAADAREDARRFGGAIGSALAGADLSTAARDFAGAVLGLRELLDLGEDLRRHRPRIAEERLPPDWTGGDYRRSERLARAVRAGCEELRPALAGLHLADLPPAYRRAGRYLQLAALRLLAETERQGAAVVDEPPALGALSRVGLLLRARWIPGSSKRRDSPD